MTKRELPPIEEMLPREPITAFKDEYRFLSNFYDGIIDLKGKMFASAEHAFQCCKTRDPEWQKRIQLARSPREARVLGRECPMRDDWEAIKVTIMRHVLAAKFPEVGVLSDKLHLTSTAELIEGNTWDDRFWGAVWDGEKWVGENMLGKLLMERRAQLFNSIPF